MENKYEFTEADRKVIEERAKEAQVLRTLTTDEEVKKHLKEMEEKSCFGRMTPDGFKVMGKFARATSEDVDWYRQLPFSELKEEYLSLYFIVYIYGQSSVSDIQLLDLIEYEIEGHRSKLELEEIKLEVKKLNEIDQTKLDRFRKGEIDSLE